jgi:trans-aconitate methyltransferase
LVKTLDRRADLSRAFWDEKARENPYWFVSSYGAYESDRNLDEFWASGANIWQDLKTHVGYQPNASDEIVEIGCGLGRLTRVMAKEVAAVHAFDISSEMLKIAAQANLPNAVFRRAEGFTLRPLPDGCADLVLGYCVFQHLPSLEALHNYLLEMVRTARKGALIAFTLTERDWKAYLLPLLRLRAYFRQQLTKTGPRGIYDELGPVFVPRKRSCSSSARFP